MAYEPQTFTAGEILTATKMNKIAGNQTSFHDGTGIDDDAITSSKIDFTTMKKWVPDYANQTKVIDTASELVNTWTATGDGFVRCENNTYNGTNHKETVIIRVNGSVAFCSANKSVSSSSAIANYLGSAPIPVCKNDVIEYETTTSGQHNLFFIPGKWV